MTVKERIKKFAKSQEKSVRAFEVKSGLNIGYVNAIRVSIQPDKIQSIASAYPDLNIDWLLTGSGQMLKQTEFEDVGQGLVTPKNDNNMIEVLKDRIKDKDDYINNLLEQIKDLKIRVEEYKGVVQGVKKGSAM